MRRQIRGIPMDFEKTIDHYYLENPDDRYDPIKIPIKMARNHSGKTMFSCKDKDRNINIEHHSIDDVMIELDNILKNRADIKWNPKLAISMASVVMDQPQEKVSSRNSLRLIHLDFSIKVVPIETGTDEKNERWERIQGSNFIQKETVRSGFRPNWKEHPEDAWHDKDQSEILIDDTPENRLAILNLASGFRGFLKRVHDVFEPDQVENTIQKLAQSSAYLLTGGTEDHG